MGVQASGLPLSRRRPGARDAPLREGGPAAAASDELTLGPASRRLLAAARVAYLATADQYARPHVVPIVFVFDEPRLYTPIDRKPKAVRDWRDLRRVRNIETNGRVSVVVDEYEEDWSRLAWVRLDGIAEVLTEGDDRDRAARLLETKYAQYQRMPLAEAPIVRVTVERASEWHG